jgi:hypothetical protein
MVGSAVGLKVLIVDDARKAGAEKPVQRALTLLDRRAPQVPPVQLLEVEGA